MREHSPREHHPHGELLPGTPGDFAEQRAFFAAIFSNKNLGFLFQEKTDGLISLMDFYPTKPGVPGPWNPLEMPWGSGSQPLQIHIPMLQPPGSDP